MLKYHIQTIEVGSGGSANIIFSNIPQIYDDLLLVTSLRDNVAAGGWENAFVYPNGSSANMASRALYGFSTTTGTLVNTPAVIYHQTARGNNTANTFSNSSVMFSGYSSANNKRISAETSVERNDASAINAITEALWSNSAPITSLTIAAATGLFVQYSYASLYGIKRGADGLTKASPVAQGGTVTASGGYTIHSFTSSGTFNLLRPATVDYLVVAGGGSGGSTTSLVDYNTGAGGAGGYRYLTSQVLQPGSYSVVIGAGGAVEGVGTPGSNSSFLSTSATGGGAGGSGGGTYVQPTSGGSGGGGGTPGTLTGAAGNAGGYSPVEGYAGGNGNSGGAGSTSGGGGGAGGAGGTPTAGPGVANSITGTSVTYATGGTGLSGGGTGSASNAAANTGNGGNAGRSQRFVSGLGGSGVVIIRYLTPA